MRKLILAVVVVAALCLIGAQARAAIIAADGFANVAGPRDPGDGLGGTQTEVGGKTWVVHDWNAGAGAPAGPIAFTNHNNITQNYAGYCYVSSGYIDFTYTEPILTVAIDAKTKMTQNSYWGVGFNTNNTEWLFPNADLSAIFNYPGTGSGLGANAWYVYSNGTSLANGSCADLDSGQWNRIELSYEPATGATVLTIGGTVRWSGGAGDGVPVFTPTYAGLHAYDQSQVGEADNFELSQTPEPATVGLMGLGLAAVLALRRRR